MSIIKRRSIGSNVVPSVEELAAITPIQERGRIVSNRMVSSEHNLFTVFLPKIGHRACAGQFVQIRVPDGSVFLPRPFSFLSASEVHCTFLSRIVGSGTLSLSKMFSGQEIEIFGPLGNGFDLSRIVEGGDEVILIGGGVGIPPLVHAAQALSPITGTAFIGASQREFLLCTDKFLDLGWSVEYATDDGSLGHHGMVTELLEDYLANRKNKKFDKRIATNDLDSQNREYPTVSILSCGPQPMLERCAQLVEGTDISCQVALEQVMACGFGVCLGCAIRIKDSSKYDEIGSNYALVCSDGPVFKSDHIDW